MKHCAYLKLTSKALPSCGALGWAGELLAWLDGSNKVDSGTKQGPVSGGVPFSNIFMLFMLNNILLFNPWLGLNNIMCVKVPGTQ